MNTLSLDLSIIQKTAVYSSGEFVGRQHALNLVARKIENLRSGVPEMRPILNFWALQGSGKTWLLQHLAQKHRYQATKGNQKSPTLTLFYEFDPTRSADNLIEEISTALAASAVRQLSPEHIPQTLKAALDAGNPLLLTQALKQLSETFTLILLLDGVEKVPAKKWQEVEQHILEGVLVKGHSLLIVSGRRQMPPWRNFELRRRVTETDDTYLEPFSLSEINSQMERLEVRTDLDLTLLWPYTAGSPLLARALIDVFKKNSQPNEVLTANWLETHKQNVLHPFRQQAIDQLLIGITPETAEVLRAVATLRFYRLAAVRYMLTKHASDSASGSREQSNHYYFRLLQSLEPDTDLAWWDSKRRAYVTSGIIRSLLNQQLKDENEAQFLTQHKQAIEMYWRFVNEMPSVSEELLLEILFHAGSMFRVDAALEILEQQVTDVLQSAREHLSAERLFTLSRQLQADSDLLTLLPTNVLSTSHARLDEMLKREPS